MNIKDKFDDFYKKIKLMFYKNIFAHLKEEEEVLSSSEYFCLECIYLMDKPTISEFAEFLDISSPNATYKVKQLIKKGFISKERSESDGREYLLVPTQKFFDFYESKDNGSVNVQELKQNLGKEDSKKVDKIVSILSSKKKRVWALFFWWFN